MENDKAITTVYIDRKLRREAKRMEISISGLFNTLLAKEMARLGSKVAQEYLNKEIKELEAAIESKRQLLEGD